jgi:hypothetical protein
MDSQAFLLIVLATFPFSILEARSTHYTVYRFEFNKANYV